MDLRGLRARLSGAGCTSCGAAVPVDRIIVLADRGDFAFVELACDGCGSRTMGVVLAAGPDDEGPVLDTAADASAGADGSRGPAPRRRRAPDRPPLREDDVVAMRRFLDTWSGDLRSLLDEPGSSGRGAGG